MTREEFCRKSEKLAQDQRGAPESAMLKIQLSGISQLYGHLAEHVGDLTNRMAQDPDFFHGGYQWVKEKVDRTENILGGHSIFNPHGSILQEIRTQIRHNLPYLKKKDGTPYESEAEAWVELRRLGRNYANEHRKLQPVNDAQRQAQMAAVFLGEFEFDYALLKIRKLQEATDKGPEAWEKYALEGCPPPAKIKRTTRARPAHRRRKSTPTTLGGLR